MRSNLLVQLTVESRPATAATAMIKTAVWFPHAISVSLKVLQSGLPCGYPTGLLASLGSKPVGFLRLSVVSTVCNYTVRHTVAGQSCLVHWRFPGTPATHRDLSNGRARVCVLVASLSTSDFGQRDNYGYRITVLGRGTGDQSPVCAGRDVTTTQPDHPLSKHLPANNISSRWTTFKPRGSAAEYIGLYLVEFGLSLLTCS